MNKIFLLLLNLFLLQQVAMAQLSGIKTIPGDYASLATAIADLNTNGVGVGGVTFNVAAGYTETGNYTINASGTASSPVVFQKSGIGANPTFTAGTGTGWDAIFKMVGSDYITFDGFTLQENAANLSGNYIQKTEFGFAFLKSDFTNGCQFNTITNCSITLDRTFLENDPIPATHMAVGIYLYNQDAAYNWINQESTVTGTHSYNTFSNNTISNVGMGIQIYGYHNTASSLAVIERHNVVTNNTISDVGGFNAMAVGINIQYAANTTISGNAVTTHVSHQSGCTGIQYTPMGLSGVLINNNTIQVNATQVNIFTTVQFGITVSNGSAIAADPGWQTIEINNNNILAASANRGYTGINCQYNIAAFCTIENNNISMTNHPSYDGTSYGIQVQNWWSHITQVSIKNNTIKDHISPLAQLYAISCEDNTDVFNVEGNKVINNNGAILRGIYLFGETGSIAQKNIVDCSNTNTVAQFTGVQIAGINNSAINNLIACRAISTSSTVHFGIATSVYTTTGNRVQHNTVYLDGGNTLGPNFSACISMNSAGLLTEVDNNIFINKMMPGTNTPGYVSSFFNYHNVSTSDFKSHHNIFYAGTPSLRNSIYNYGISINIPATIDSTFILYKQRVCDKDSNSLSGDIEFLSFDPLNANYLHINPVNASLANNNGKALASISNDYDNDVRNATTPDIGADEFSGITATATIMQTSPVLWLSADAGVYLDAGITPVTDGQTVQQWNDQSCNAFDASQSDPSKRPTWQQYAFNGKPALWFDGNSGNQYLNNITQNLVSPGAARTVFVVAKKRCIADDGGALFTFRRSSFMATLEWVNVFGNLYIYSDGVAGSGVNNAIVNAALDSTVTNNPAVLTYNVPSANSNIEFYLNGNQQSVVQVGNVVSETGTTGFTVGDREDLSTQPWDGWISEVIVYDRALSSTERQAVENYLQQKYVTSPTLAQFASLPTSTTSSNITFADATWKHPFNSGDNTQALVSINDNCYDLGTLSSTAYVEASPVQIGSTYAMRRHFTIQSTLNPTGTKRVRLYYSDDDFTDLQTMVPTLTAHSQLVVTKYDGPNEDGVFNSAGGSLTFIPSTQITTGTAFGQRYLEFDVTDFSEFWIHTGNVVLPVEIHSFSVDYCNEKACLQWAVGEENNVRHYEVEHSVNALDFVKITTVNASQQASYSFKHLNPVNGTNYYRIKTVDRDDKENYSSVASLYFKYGVWSVSIEPCYNQHGLFTIRSNEAVSAITIYNTNGGAIKTIEYPSKQINLSDLPNGLYLIKVTTQKESKLLKVLK